MEITRPMEHPGTEAERWANFETHWWNHESSRCDNCDCRPWGDVAFWPCGAEVPRVITVEEG